MARLESNMTGINRRHEDEPESEEITQRGYENSMERPLRQLQPMQKPRFDNSEIIHKI